MTTDANGLNTVTALYKAFGETRYTDGNLGTDYKFTGQREEAALGIYWFQSRWFDPSLGRFTSPDTIVPTGTQGTQAWDRYAFVNNNPVRYNDPTGHSACSGVNDDCMESGGAFATEGGGGSGASVDAAAEEVGSTTVEAAEPYEWIEKLEETDTGYNPHTITKHAPDADGSYLFENSLKSSVAQTRFSSSVEMEDSIMQAIDDNLENINQIAESAKLGQTEKLLGEEVGFNGYENVMYKTGIAPVKVVIMFDGQGGWFLYTAYPAP